MARGVEGGAEGGGECSDMWVCVSVWVCTNEMEKLAQLENSLNKLNWFELLHSIVALFTAHSHADWLTLQLIHLFMVFIAGCPSLLSIQNSFEMRAVLNWIFDNDCKLRRVCTRALWVIAFVLIHIRANFHSLFQSAALANVRMYSAYSLSTSVWSVLPPTPYPLSLSLSPRLFSYFKTLCAQSIWQHSLPLSSPAPLFLYTSDYRLSCVSFKSTSGGGSRGEGQAAVEKAT